MGRRRAVIEDVPLVPFATGAMVFGSPENQLVVGPGFQPSFDRGVKARPAGAAFIFHFGGEQGEVAPRADIKPLPLYLHERA